ncbi:MAG: hypothetical protein JJ913_11540 [Rhizobiaceae bacterium]|nr:hypothetical protein [Rhizobiaceae bacterium]
MPALALADALKDFGSPLRPAAPGAASAATPPLHMPPPVSLVGEDAIEAAVAKATAELTAKLQEEHAAAIEALNEAHRKELASVHSEFGERIGPELVARIDEMQERLVALTSSVAARILGIALTEDVQAKALESLASAIREAVRDRDAVRIGIRAPLSLYEALQPALGKLADRVEFTETTGIDITAVVDDAIYETRLSEWSASLSEIMS